MGVTVNRLKSRVAIRRDLGIGTRHRLEVWVNRNLMKFRKDKCKVLQLRRPSPLHPIQPLADWLVSGFREEDLWSS